MARYAYVEAGTVVSTVEYDPDQPASRCLPAEEEAKLVEIPRGLPVEAGWGCDGSSFTPPIGPRPERDPTARERVATLEDQVSDLGARVTTLEGR